MNQIAKSFIDPFPHKLAEISELLERLSQEEQAIEENRNDKDKRREHELRAENLRQQLLAQADCTLVYHYMEATKIADKNEFRTTWQNNFPIAENNDWFDFVQNYSVDLVCLPAGSFYIQFEFTLLKPYISRDDNDFYIIDNPIVRDKVFRYPMVRPTAWKGALRHALWQLGYKEENDQIQRLFGTANDDRPEEGKAGRLYFYPSFFAETSLEVINPHDRERRVGKNPILMECVPIGTSATFTLLYTPLDRVGQDEAETHRQVAADLQLVAEGLQAMFTTYGFGAKTSSGFGVADDAVENGKLVLKWPEFTFAQTKTDQVQAPDEAYLKYLDENGQIKPDFLGSGDYGLMSNKEYKEKGAPLGGGSLSEFKAFRQWYGEYGRKWQDALKAKTPNIDYPQLNFNSLNRLAETLRQAGGEG